MKLYYISFGEVQIASPQLICHSHLLACCCLAANTSWFKLVQWGFLVVFWVLFVFSGGLIWFSHCVLLEERVLSRKVQFAYHTVLRWSLQATGSSS